MESEKRQPMESVYSKKIRAGRRRTYFFDVRQTKGEDYYLTMTESTKRFNGTGYERHKIFLYKEDFNRFLTTLEDVINYVKVELMPDFDYDEFTRRHEEYERMRAAEAEEAAAAEKQAAEEPTTMDETPTENVEETSGAEGGSEEASTTEDAPDTGDASDTEDAIENEEDMSW